MLPRCLFLLVLVLAVIGSANGVHRVAREAATRDGTVFYHIEDGWHYHFSYARPGVAYFKCVRWERGCRGRALFRPAAGFVHTQGHNGHENDPHYPAEMCLRRSILDRCRDRTNLTYRQILRRERNRFANEVAARVTINRMRTPMRNARMESYPNLPENNLALTHYLTDHEYQVLTISRDGEDNLYAGSVTAPDGSHHVLFISARMLNHLRTVRIIHGDGTFSSAPNSPRNAQVFCIVTTWLHTVIPCLWVLMENRLETSYISVFRLLRHLLGAGNGNFQLIISDFEAAQQNAFEAVFPGAQIQGCLFHLCRAMVDYARNTLGLAAYLLNVPFVADVVRRCVSLALLPEEYIRQGFLLLAREAFQEADPLVYNVVRPFLVYVWRRWVRSERRRLRMCVCGSPHRTNNACESANQCLQLEVAGPHPNVFRLLEAFSNIEQEAYLNLMALRNHVRPGRARRCTAVANDQHIRNDLEALRNPPDDLDAAILRFIHYASHTFDDLFRGLVDPPNRRQQDD